ncbi:beta-TrCP [Nannizzia gypsea CBS 118893]|uniref:Probable E3 ubiquitin ligase complex SCF subunit sconB n=1 Tax=Arthroderma gypseum (strain ATCC MYA-4604 / CBS 118893) TaxID=535722 RepID=E5R3F1_ARTGP|nr:beta-TrCP [Nannizzia gypsea CBS 118893]EFQ97966.1 beta-TrCP [Nannizzia gypsea CBS 118893]
MSCCTSNANPGRRRSTLRSRVRPLTSAGGEHQQHHHQTQDGLGRAHDGVHKEALFPFPGESHQSAIVETDEALSATVPRSKHRHSKSFSSILHGASELKTITRSLSISIRNKGKRAAQAPGEQLSEHQSHEESKAGWFRSHRLPRRRSLGGICNLNKLYPLASSPPMPSNCKDFTHTQQNGQLVDDAAGRKGMLAPPLKGEDEGMEIFELAGHLGVKLALDSESGISINIQDTDDNAKKLDCVRKDPVSLPAELMAHILSFLDADSLKNAELVSSSWNVHASSSNVWREVFYREYRDSRNVANTPGIPKRAMGLGKKKPAQDWKKVYKVRHTLENRWKSGKAAAIYLHGHQDSVYCVQFDENKIITGSRDRTIRVWDARYPWPCLKVIGAHQATSDSSVPVTPWPITPPADSTGSSPFISICPPVASTADLISHHESGEYHNASILCLQFDDKIMVTGSSDATCIVWDMQDNYRPIRRLKWHQAGVLDVCFDDKHIVSCSKDTTICVWDRETGQLLKRLLGHRGPVNAVQLRGDLVVSASGDGVAKLWNISSGLCIKEFASKDRGLACVEFSEDARTILAGGNDQVIYQFDANTGELVKELEGHSGLVRSLHMDNANGRVVSGSYDMSIKVFDAKAGKLSIDLPGWTTSWMLSAKSDYRRIVATSQDARAVIMDFGYGLDGIESLEG